MNLFDVYWPELYDLGFVNILRTPVLLVTLKDKTQLEFFTERDYNKWEATDGIKLKGWSKKYYKGLSSWSTKQFATFFDDLPKYLYRIEMEDVDDKDAMDLAFNGDRADDRKIWLETPSGDFEDFIVNEKL